MMRKKEQNKAERAIEEEAIIDEYEILIWIRLKN